MSKVLKFIVHFVVICTLICVLGLVLPPFFGVRTVIVDKSDKATNLPVGSVTYAIPEKSSAITYRMIRNNTTRPRMIRPSILSVATIRYPT